MKYTFKSFRWLRDPKIYYITDKQQSNLPTMWEYLNHIKSSLVTEDLANKFSLIISDKYIYENKIKHIGKQDLVIWDPDTASKNIFLVQKFNSIILLLKPTIFIQKQSKHNPFTENMAINLGVNINYVYENDKEITNEEYKLVVSDNYYNIKNLGEYILNFIQKQNGNKKQQ